MAVLCVERLLATQLVLDLPTVTAAFVAGLEVGIVLVDFVWCTILPFIELAMHVTIVAIVAIGNIGLFFAHSVRSVKLRFELRETGKRAGSWDYVCQRIQSWRSDLQIEAEEARCCRHAVWKEGKVQRRT